MVGLNGLEPSTSRLSGVRSNQLSYRPTYGGDKEIRTLDPLRARQVLSQLSYTPILKTFGLSKLNRDSTSFRRKITFHVFGAIFNADRDIS